MEERLTPSVLQPIGTDAPAMAGQANPFTTGQSTTTMASPASTTYSTSAQNVTLTATVTSNGTPVTIGTVTFTILQGSTVIGTATSAPVNSSGVASVSYALPAGTAAGSYTIDASYTDSTGTFAPSSDTSQMLTVNAASTTTAASAATATFSTSDQNVTLSATVTSPGGTVNEGSVTFTLMQGSTVIGTATSGSVTNGAASVTYVVPGGTAAGTYTIVASYTDSAGNFANSSDSSQSLTLNPAPTTTAASAATATFSTSDQDVTLSATVTSPGGTVNEGTVTFTLMQGSTVIGTATSGNVTNGAASVSYVVPGGTAAGTYTIVASYTDSAGNFANSSDSSQSLTVNPAATTTAAAPASATFSTSDQNVTLTATVTSPGGTVNEGTVTFTLMQGSTVIGTATSGSVSDGTASVSYVVPGGTAAGTYTIVASYTDSSGNFADSSDSSQSLTVNPAATTTAAVPASATFSTSAQNVTLTATVTSPAGTVNEGTVTFTIMQGSNVIGTATSGNVSNGSANVSYALPAGTAAGTYTIVASYHDSTGNFADSSDSSQTLAVNSAATATTASNAMANFSSTDQNVTLTATVTSPAGTVNEGTVTFTIMQGSTVIGTATPGTVSNGTASVSYVLPGGTAVGTYTINASYTDSTGNFSASADTSHTLTVSSATTTTASNATANFSPSAQNVTLTATVTSPAGTVNEGTMTFTIMQGTTVIGTATSASVSNGSASVSYALPAGTAAGTYTIVASYTDSTGTFANSSDNTHTLTINAAATTTTVTSTAVTATFNGNADQQVTLTASVTSTGGTVNEGTVTFTVMQGTTVIGTATPGTVSNGTASVQYTLPAGTAAGTYTIVASYHDSTGNFADSNNSTQSPAPTVTISVAGTTTTASNATLVFSASNQNVLLTATVTSSNGTVNQGTVEFTVVDSLGNVIGTAMSGNVTNGSASVSYLIPGGTAPGTYTINAVFHPPTTGANFGGSADNLHTLTVSASASTTISLTRVNITPNFTSSNATVTLTLQVSNPGGTVNEGFVSFTMAGVTGTANVVNGTGTVQVVVPLTAVLNRANVTFSYTDNATPPSFTSAGNSLTLYLNIANALLPSVVQFASDGTQFNQIPVGNQTLFAFAYSMVGLLTQINTGSLTFPVTYTHVGNMIFSAIGGLPWQILFLNSSGQLQGFAQIQLTTDGTAEWVFYSPDGLVLGTMPLS